jgi:serine/threonine-protein kinase
MEYLQGESLADRLKRESRSIAARALSIARQIADALNASHEHGDHPPRPEAGEHLPRATRGRNRDFVKVLDFGLAKLTQSEQKVTAQDARRLGDGARPITCRPSVRGEGSRSTTAPTSTRWACCCFEMLTGKVPFGGEGYGEIIVKHVTHAAAVGAQAGAGAGPTSSI